MVPEMNRIVLVLTLLSAAAGPATAPSTRPAAVPPTFPEVLGQLAYERAMLQDAGDFARWELDPKQKDAILAVEKILTADQRKQAAPASLEEAIEHQKNR
jgi:hypothetical protein